MKVENRMRKPIVTDPRGKSAVVDEAPDGTKAIPVTFVYKAEDGFVHDDTPRPGTEIDNEMRKPVASDSRGNAEVVDEDVNGVKAIPLVPVKKNANGEFEYAEIGGGGDVTVDWTDVQNKPTTYPPATHDHDGAYAAINHNHDGVYQPAGNYAAANHNHDGTYAPVSHTHTVAQVSGLQGALDAKLSASKAAAQADSAAEDVAGLVADFNALLAKLRAAGIMA